MGTLSPGPCPTLLARPCGIILQIICLLWVLQISRLATGNPYFVFYKVVLQVRVFSLDRRPRPVFWGYSVYRSLFSMLCLRSGTGAGSSVGGVVGLALKVLGLCVSQVGISLSEVHSVAPEWASCGSSKCSQQKPHPFHASWYSYLPLSWFPPSPTS